jgi:hypothetical protein
VLASQDPSISAEVWTSFEPLPLYRPTQNPRRKPRFPGSTHFRRSRSGRVPPRSPKTRTRNAFVGTRRREHSGSSTRRHAATVLELSRGLPASDWPAVCAMVTPSHQSGSNLAPISRPVVIAANKYGSNLATDVSASVARRSKSGRLRSALLVTIRFCWLSTARCRVLTAGNEARTKRGQSKEAADQSTTDRKALGKENHPVGGSCRGRRGVRGRRGMTAAPGGSSGLEDDPGDDFAEPTAEAACGRT